MNIGTLNIEDVIDIQESKLKQFHAKKIFTVSDLLHFYPRRYEDRSNFITENNLANNIGEKISLYGEIVSCHADYTRDILNVNIKIGNTDVRICWFKQNYLGRQFIAGDKWVFYGKLDYKEPYGYSITSPIFFSQNIEEVKRPMPIYSKIAGMSDAYLKSCIQKCLSEFEKVYDIESDRIDEEIREAAKIEDELSFLKKVHIPSSMNDVENCSRRMAVETIIPFAWELLDRKYKGRHKTDKTVDEAQGLIAYQAFTSSLSFKLTQDQDATIKAMIKTITSGKRLDALVQGDVGCGKTMVALAMACVMAKGGYQIAIMAPTTILAEQHYHEFNQRLESLGITSCLLDSKAKAAERRKTLKEIFEGKVQVIIGTQSVLNEEVKFNNLGLTIVDEEHRFGVRQRKKLQEKALEGAHSISMSATPIPRSIALTIYGEDTVIYNIHTMPSGRKPVKTIVYSDEERTYEALYRQIKLGRQGYVVCPLITSNESMTNVDSLEETEEKCRKFFTKYPEVKILCINGKMKPDEIKTAIDEFASGKAQILLSTTIVEVGVNVPNATVMIIKNAERFGLAQLHQLRGRVGRGTDQAFCVLLSKDKTNPRLQVMSETTDGFVIAQKDLEQRGTGNLVGTEQSGFDIAVDTMIKNPTLYKTVYEELEEIFIQKQRFDHYSSFTNTENL